MADGTTETKVRVQRLARDLTTQIELNYMPEEMAQVAPALVSLYQARVFGPLPESVESVIGKIEQAVAAEPYYSCSDCGALFHDTDDLGILPSAEIELLDPGETIPVGSCPACGGSDVHPRAAKM